jgi:hypothetical protein
METTDGTGTSIAGVRSESAARASDLLGDALLLTRELRAGLYDQLSLAGYEAQLAARSLSAMVAAAVGIGVLLVSAWLGLLAAGTSALIDLGLAPAIAMLIGAALNLIALLSLYGLIRRKSRNLAFPATRRTVQPASLRGHESSGRHERNAA